jgi:hypothetical protein
MFDADANVSQQIDSGPNIVLDKILCLLEYRFDQASADRSVNTQPGLPSSTK